MPYSEMVGYIDACCGELPTHIHIAATDRYCSDLRVRRTIQTATEGGPAAAVLFGYVVCRHSSCCGEATTRVHVAATDTYVIDVGSGPTVHTATESRPSV